MPRALNTGTREIPLKFARHLSNIVRAEWESGALLERVTPVTKELLTFWFADAFCDLRAINFHEGQKQAILNTVYLHELVKPESVFDMYTAVSSDITAEMDIAYLRKDKFSHPKYCHKMATGTGKTWVLDALVIWQYLNAKYEKERSGLFSKRFLLVAPGLIVYERLLDAFLGKEDEERHRQFNSSDIARFRDLFIPPVYRDDVFGFVQNNVVRKDEIGRKVTGEGLIAITNWHLLVDKEEEAPEAGKTVFDDPAGVVKELLPIRPGTSAGHALDALDGQYLSGGELEYLAALPDVVVFNDEAHHIHETKTAGIVSEVEWQRSLDRIAEGKGRNFLQIDFSATPYDVTGSGQNRSKHYFPHIITDFNLHAAIHQGLVKIITLDKRKSLAAQDLDFKAVRDDANKVVALSEGQKLMLRAGMEKLKILEKQFVTVGENKHPKMLVICEDTNVSPFVIDFLCKSEGLSDDEVVQIDSDKKGNIPTKEWDEIKQRLFNIDSHEKPRVIVSVLMLREGFDVNNICVIVPLRSSQAPILLEQVIGRGLRLMWREPDFTEMKTENRQRILQQKAEPSNYLDILSIVEHPEYVKFYEDMEEYKDLLFDSGDLPTDRESVLGDIITVGLKKDAAKYDLFWPFIMLDSDEVLSVKEPKPEYLASIDWYSLDQLKKMVGREGETFYSEEMTVKTRFGEYRVTGAIFTAESYNEYLARLVDAITFNISAKVGGGRIRKSFPVMQIQHPALLKIIDEFIRHRLFKQEFDPFVDENWRILMLSKQGIVQHILQQVSEIIYDMQKNVNIEEAVVRKHFFSEVDSLKMRERYSLPIVKTIYERLPYPSVRGGFEKEFMLFCDTDSKTEAFVKINEHYHDFAHLKYIRSDGLLASYSPDFLVKAGGTLYIVETKATKDVKNPDVVQKQRAATDWVKKINELKPEDRGGCEWKYVLLSEKAFYSMRELGADILEILEHTQITAEQAWGKLF